MRMHVDGNVRQVVVHPSVVVQAAMVLACASAFTAPSLRAAPIDYRMVTVRDAGNAADTTGYGAVNEVYRIGTYEVTIRQYTTFLNAVAKSDPNRLYSPAAMGGDLNSAGITRSGVSGSYSYSVMTNGGDSSNRPMAMASWWIAARFANWMANGQPTGSQNAGTTENGAYNTTDWGANIAPPRNAINPNTGASPTYWIPTENEWYKAAYYSPVKGGVGVPGYYLYATQSDTPPGNAVGTAANQANYQTGSGFSVTQSVVYSSGQNYLTDVGAFVGSASHYGTFDQSGNVFEWLDGALPGSQNSVARGGSWDRGIAADLSSSFRVSAGNMYEYPWFGFRLAGSVDAAPVPEIDPAGLASVLSLVGGAMGLLERRRPRVA